MVYLYVTSTTLYYYAASMEHYYNGSEDPSIIIIHHTCMCPTCRDTLAARFWSGFIQKLPMLIFTLFHIITVDENSCSSSQFKCDNGSCVRYSYECGNYDDSGDNSDKENCGSSDSMSLICKPALHLIEKVIYLRIV